MKPLGDEPVTSASRHYASSLPRRPWSSSLPPFRQRVPTFRQPLPYPPAIRTQVPSSSMDSYDKWTPTTLQAECTRRAVDTSGTKAQLIKRVADDGFVKHKKQRQSSFDQTSDPNGRHEQAELESRAAFERNYWRVILNNDIEYFERMLAGKTKELSTKLEQVEENLKKEVGALNKRVRGYENTHLASKLGGKGGSVKKQKPKQVEKKQEPKQVEEKRSVNTSAFSTVLEYANKG